MSAIRPLSRGNPDIQRVTPSATVLLVFGAPSQLPSLAGLEHGRTHPISGNARRHYGCGKGALSLETIVAAFRQFRAEALWLALARRLGHGGPHSSSGRTLAPLQATAELVRATVWVRTDAAAQ